MLRTRALADALPKAVTLLVAAMGVAVLALCLSLMNLSGCGGSTHGSAKPSPLNAQAAYAHVKAMVEIGPRPAGSEQLKQCRDYIVNELAKFGVKARIDAFEDKENAPKVASFFNIEAEIRGTRENDQRILVIGSHYDTKLAAGHPNSQDNFEFVGANDAASSSGLLIELARHYQKNPPPIDLLFVWFDGEESIRWIWDREERDNLIGSRHCVKQLRKRFPAPLSKSVPVMVLLDMVGAKDLAIVHDSEISDPGLIDIFRKASVRTGNETKFFQLKVAVTDDHVPFNNLSIHTIDLIQFDGGGSVSPWWHTKSDTMDIISAESLGIVGHVVVEALPEVVREFYPVAN